MATFHVCATTIYWWLVFIGDSVSFKLQAEQSMNIIDFHSWRCKERGYQNCLWFYSPLNGLFQTTSGAWINPVHPGGINARAVLHWRASPMTLSHMWAVKVSHTKSRLFTENLKWSISSIPHRMRIVIRILTSLFCLVFRPCWVRSLY